MNSDSLTLQMNEWQRRDPSSDPRLANLTLPSEPIRRMADELRRQRRLEIIEWRTGLAVRSFSYVGRISMGALDVVISPKVEPPELLLDLLRYAFGFRRLHLFSKVSQSVGPTGLDDLLVHQLNAEASELIARGLHRSYQPVRERLAAPRGGIDISRLAHDGGLITAELPCRHFPRVDDNTVNRVLLAGLHLAATLALDLDLRRESLRLAALLQERVSRVRLDRVLWQQLQRKANRLTAAYEPALSIVRILADSRKVTLKATNDELPLPGFLFDMNRFFQALISRFLHGHLTGWEVRDEVGLRGMICFDDESTVDWMPPTVRPDFVVTGGARVVAILDAKYRDLWQHRLPREMLYQLALYAGAHPRRIAAILYPTMTEAAEETRLIVREPVHGRCISQICLRPVKIRRLHELVMQPPSASNDWQCQNYARWLALGKN